MGKKKKWTLDGVLAHIDSGAGQGRFHDYRPWLRISRNFSSPVSFQHFCHLPLRDTNYHLMSHLEYRTALLNCYAGALELREGLPLWPHDHRHPNRGICAEHDAHLGQVEGLYTIARRAGIDLGVFVGTNVAYVANCDQVFLVPGERRELVFVSNKPEAIYESKARARERVELDRLYAASVGARHVLDTGEQFDLMLIENLNWFLPLRSELQRLRASPVLSEFCERLKEAWRVLPLDAAIEKTRCKLKLAQPDGQLHFRVGCWVGYLDVDLRQHVAMSEFVKTDGGAARNWIRCTYWGTEEVA